MLYFFVFRLTCVSSFSISRIRRFLLGMSKWWVQNQGKKQLLLLFKVFLQMDCIHFLWKVMVLQQIKFKAGNDISMLPCHCSPACEWARLGLRCMSSPHRNDPLQFWRHILTQWMGSAKADYYFFNNFSIIRIRLSPTWFFPPLHQEAMQQIVLFLVI